MDVRFFHYSFYVYCFFFSGLSHANEDDLDVPRYVSLAPSITEIIFELDVAESLVGVTQYCDFPAAAKEVDKVGGYLDPSIEVIISMKPTLVFGLREHQRVFEQLSALGVKTLAVDQNRLDGVLQSISVVAEAVERKKRGDELRALVETELGRLKKIREGKNTLNTLVAVGTTTQAGAVVSAYVAGGDTFYGDLLGLAGGINVYSGHAAYAKLGAEPIVVGDPEVIIELVPEGGHEFEKGEDIYSRWSAFSSISAYKNCRIFQISNELAVNPGPRISQILESFVEALETPQAVRCRARK